MTIVAIERQADDTLWLMADSQISGGPRTIHGGKVLPIQVQLAKPDANGRFVDQVARSVGFAYSGSSTAALNAYALISAALSNLLSSPKNGFPSLGEIAAFSARCGATVIADLVNSSPEGIHKPSDYFFEAIIAGYGPPDNPPGAFKISPMIGERFEMRSERIRLPIGVAATMGSAKDRFSALAADATERGLLFDAFTLLQVFLKLDRGEDVGGWVQAGVASGTSFKIWPVIRLPAHRPDGHGEIMMSGLDVSGLGGVGENAIGYEVLGEQPLGRVAELCEILGQKNRRG